MIVLGTNELRPQESIKQCLFCANILIFSILIFCYVFVFILYGCVCCLLLESWQVALVIIHLEGQEKNLLSMLELNFEHAHLLQVIASVQKSLL